MVRTKDSKTKDYGEYRRIGDYRKWILFVKEAEVSLGRRNALNAFGQLYNARNIEGEEVNASSVEELKRKIDRYIQIQNKDSKTKDGEDQTIGNYNGYHIVFNGGFIRAQEDGFTKIEFPSSMGAGGWSRADVQKMFDKIDARRSGTNDSYTQWRIVKSKNGKVIEEKSFQTSGDDSESFVKWREEKQKNSGLGNKLEMYQGNQLVATTDAEEPSTEGKSQDLAYIRKLIDEDVYGKGQRDSKTKDAGNCSNYRSDTESCRTGCKRIRVNPGEACPFDLETERGRWPGDFQADCPCYK
jgi:hypothetical protein